METEQIKYFGFKQSNGSTKLYLSFLMKSVDTMNKLTTRKVEDWPALKFLTKECFGHSLMHLTYDEYQILIDHCRQRWDMRFCVSDQLHFNDLEIGDTFVFLHDLKTHCEVVDKGVIPHYKDLKTNIIYSLNINPEVQRTILEIKK